MLKRDYYSDNQYEEWYIKYHYIII
jgi:hypothetical protein